MREVAALVGEERVVDAAVDDRTGRVERPLRVGRLDRERVVDHERRTGGAVRGRGDRGSRGRERDEYRDHEAHPPAVGWDTTQNWPPPSA